MHLLQAVVNGILIGGVYALISVGLTLIFGIMHVVNFAQAEFLMLGMFGAFVAWSIFGIDPIVSALVVGVILFCLGALIERTLIEPIIKTPVFSQIFLTVGLGIVLRNGAAVVFGNDFHSVQTAYQTRTIDIGSLSISVPYLLAFSFAAVSAVLLYLFLQRTKFGRAMRATAQNRDAAILLGISPRKNYMVAFGLGIGLTGLAGAVILPYTTVYPTAGTQYILIMFTVVVLGGLSSIYGAMISGLIVGMIQSVSTVFLPTELQNLVLFIIFFAALVLLRGGVLNRVRLRTN